MKRTVLVVVLVLALTFAFATSASATTGKFFANSTSYYQWNKPAVIPPGTGSPNGLSGIGDNPTNPGAHANYLATTAKCGMCHSVHRAAGDGVKLLPTSDATCAGCHTGGTAITAKIITWTPYSTSWIPNVDFAVYPGGRNNPQYALDYAAGGAARTKASNATLNKAEAGGAATNGGPHNDSLVNLLEDGLWDGTGTPPLPDYEGARYGCSTRRCHATNPHGAGGSKYKIFAAKMLFNEPANDDELGDGTYGGLDAVWDDLGATDAAVERFVSANSSIVSTTAAGDILIHGVAPDANEKHALVAGLTCGRPSNPTTGEDECHAEAAYAIVDKGIKEQRNHATGITAGNAYRTDNTGAELPGYGGNDNRDWKTGHVAGTFAAVPGAASYAPIAGCTSCHDQTDKGNTVYGNFTFPHGQAPTGVTNLTTDGNATLATGVRSRLWSGYSGSVGATMTYTAGTNQKAYDGQCLKCHRDTGGTTGIGLTK